MFKYLFILFLATPLFAFGQLSVTSGGLQGQGDSRYISLIAKNNGKKALKNVRVSCVLTLKMNIKGQQSVIERDEIFDIAALAPGKTFEFRASANQAVLGCTNVGKVEVSQR